MGSRAHGEGGNLDNTQFSKGNRTEGRIMGANADR